MPQINKSCDMWLLYLASFSRDLSSLDSTTIILGWSCCWFIICIFSPQSLRKAMGSNGIFWRGGGGSTRAAGKPKSCSEVESSSWGASNPTREWGRVVLTGLGLPAEKISQISLVNGPLFSWEGEDRNKGRIWNSSTIKTRCNRLHAIGLIPWLWKTIDD